MRKYYLKKISIFLVITIWVTLLPSISNKTHAEEASNIIINEKEEANIVKEIEELREEYSKQFLKSDGTYEAVVYNKPIHYKDGDNWIEIDNTLREELDNDLKEIDEKEENLETVNEIDSIKNEDNLKEESGIDNKDKENIIEDKKEEFINNDDSKKEENTHIEKDNEENKDIDAEDKIDENNQIKNKEKLDKNNANENKTNENNKEEIILKESDKEVQNKVKIDDSKEIRKNEVNNILTNESNSFSINISKYSDSKKLIKIYKDDYELSWGIESVNPVKYENVIKDDNSINKEIEGIVNKKINENNRSKSKEKIEKDKSIIVENEKKKTLKNISDGVNYKNIFENVDLNYTIDSNIVKENIVIKDKVDIAEFEFNINTQNLIAKQIENGIKFYDINNQEKEVFSIEKPYMYDKKGDDSRDIKLEFKKTKDGYKLKLIANKEWINSKERTFPIVIDPIVNTS